MLIRIFSYIVQRPQPPLERSAVTDAAPTGNKAVDDHCSPSTLGGSTGEAVNHFRQETLAEYLEIGRLCSSNGLEFSVPILQKGTAFFRKRGWAFHHAKVVDNFLRCSNVAQCGCYFIFIIHNLF